MRKLQKVAGRQMGSCSYLIEKRINLLLEKSQGDSVKRNRHSNAKNDIEKDVEAGKDI